MASPPWVWAQGPCHGDWVMASKAGQTQLACLGFPSLARPRLRPLRHAGCDAPCAPHLGWGAS